LSRLGRITAATIAGCTLLLTTTAGSSLAADTTAVGVGAAAYVDDYAVDVFVEQAIESALLGGGFQEVGVFVNVSHGNVILSGFMSPQLHFAVQELVADTLGGIPLPLPFAVAVLIPTGLALPDLGLALDVILPDLTAPLTTLGVTDRIVSY
jgi:hypothetical protein